MAPQAKTPLVPLALAPLQRRPPADPPPAAPPQTARYRPDAFTVYWPLSRLASLAEAAGLPVASFPLSYYRHCSFYTLRTDARDRFGTPLE
jgi:hypothetical protein